MKMSEMTANDLDAERVHLSSPDVVPSSEKVSNTVCETSESIILAALVVDEIGRLEVDDLHLHDKVKFQNSVLDSNNSSTEAVDKEGKENCEETIALDESCTPNDNTALSNQIDDSEQHEKNNEVFKDETFAVLEDSSVMMCTDANCKVNEIYLPDVVPALTGSSSLDIVYDEHISEEPTSYKEAEIPLQMSEDSGEAGDNVGEKMHSCDFGDLPIRSALKKDCSSKKNLRVTFSDSDIRFIEDVLDPEQSDISELDLKKVEANWDQWEAFSNALKLSLDSFSSDDLSFSLTPDETEDVTDFENTFSVAKTSCESEESEPDISTCQDYRKPEDDVKKTVTKKSDIDYHQSLTEANVRKHESLLIYQQDNCDSDSDSTSSQDTIIMMTTEESIRNQELIEQSQRRYKQLIRGSSSSSSHESEVSSQTNFVMRTNSSVRRCLERTALRRSLTRCAEIRRRTREDLAANREKENSSLIEKLKQLCDVSTLSHEENSVASMRHCTINENMPLSCFDLQQVQQFMTCSSPVDKLYLQNNEVRVPGDVRQWKIFSKLPNDSTDCTSSLSLKQHMLRYETAYETAEEKPSDNNKKKDEGNFYDWNSETIKFQNANNFFKDDPNIAELEFFVQQDQDRTERLKKRYSSAATDEVCNEYGFYQRPSVRGIKPKFSSTTEIIEQLQRQASIPKLLQSDQSHFTWPYPQCSNTNETMKSCNSYNFHNLFSKNNELETVLENEVFHSLPKSRQSMFEDVESSVLKNYEKPFQSYETIASQIDKLTTDSSKHPVSSSDTYSFQACNINVCSCPPYIPPPAPPYISQFSEEPVYKHIGDINSHFYASRTDSTNMLPVCENKTDPFMFDV